MSNLSIFTFERQQVRLVGTAENPEWGYCGCSSNFISIDIKSGLQQVFKQSSQGLEGSGINPYGFGDLDILEEVISLVRDKK